MHGTVLRVFQPSCFPLLVSRFGSCQPVNKPDRFSIGLVRGLRDLVLSSSATLDLSTSWAKARRAEVLSEVLLS